MNYNLGFAYSNFGIEDRAIEYLKNSIVLKTNYIPAYILLATIYIKRKDYANAIEIYEKCLRLNDNINLADIYIDLFFIYYFNKDLINANKIQERAIKIFPEHPKILELKAFLEKKIK